MGRKLKLQGASCTKYVTGTRSILLLIANQSDLEPDVEAQGQKLEQNGMHGLDSSKGLARRAGSNVREEAKSKIVGEITALLHGCFANSSAPIALEAAQKEMKGHAHHQTSAVQCPKEAGGNEVCLSRKSRCIKTKLRILGT
jgi:hypothetical protein